MKFSANLGFLWSELSLTDAIFAAKAAGFDAVEFHWPYNVPTNELKSALDETGLPLLGLNTRRGDSDKGEMGLSALPGREEEARRAINEAISVGAALGAQNVHVMAGFSEGTDAAKTFADNLSYACNLAQKQNMTVLIEPLNPYDAPGYFLKNTDQAQQIIKDLGFPNLKLMFDCYHVQLTEGDLTHRLTELLPLIGHIQFAAVPNRGQPDQGELNYDYIFDLITALGHEKPLGAEYRPNGPTEVTLEWLVHAR